MKNKIKKVLLVFGVTALMLGMAKEVSTNVRIANENMETCYIIYDIADVNGDIISVEMMDGSIHEYYVEDIPESCELVVFKTVNQDDYTTYEIVALR